MRNGIFIIMSVWLAFSCQEIKDCELDTSTDYAVIRFYQADSTERTEKEVAFSLVTESTSNFYLSSTSDNVDDDTVSVMGLFMNPEAEEVNYVFQTDSQDFDLKIEYIPHLRIYYDECDPVYSFKLDSVYSNEFDSVVIVNRVLDRVVSSNIEIYF